MVTQFVQKDGSVYTPQADLTQQQGAAAQATAPAATGDWLVNIGAVPAIVTTLPTALSAASLFNSSTVFFLSPAIFFLIIFEF